MINSPLSFWHSKGRDYKPWRGEGVGSNLQFFDLWFPLYDITAVITLSNTMRPTVVAITWF